MCSHAALRSDAPVAVALRQRVGDPFDDQFVACACNGHFSQHSGLADKDTSPRTTTFQALTLVGQRFVPLGTIQGALAINLYVSAGLKPLGLNQKRCYTEQKPAEACSELIQVEGKPNAAREGAD